jgi:hypothetical protein
VDRKFLLVPVADTIRVLDCGEFEMDEPESSKLAKFLLRLDGLRWLVNRRLNVVGSLALI